jgi:hypothetical protein
MTTNTFHAASVISRFALFGAIFAASVGLLSVAAEAKSNFSGAPSIGGSHGTRGGGGQPIYVNPTPNRGSHYNRGHYGHNRHHYRGSYWGIGGWGYPWGYSGYLGAGWYRPGLAIGLTVPLLPFGYSTHYVDRTPYYVHENVYYVRDGESYRVIDRPQEAPLPPGPPPVVAAPPVVNGPAPTYVQQEKTGQLFAYPRNNQSASTATFDRIECERWASQQTGYLPAQSADNAAKKGDYQRAVAACLEGRGYSVR